MKATGPAMRTFRRRPPSSSTMKRRSSFKALPWRREEPHRIGGGTPNVISNDPGRQCDVGTEIEGRQVRTVSNRSAETTRRDFNRRKAKLCHGLSDGRRERGNLVDHFKPGRGKRGTQLPGDTVGRQKARLSVERTQENDSFLVNLLVTSARIGALRGHDQRILVLNNPTLDHSLGMIMVTGMDEDDVDDHGIQDVPMP